VGGLTFFSCPPDDGDYDALLWEQVVSDLREMGFSIAPTRDESKSAHPANGGATPSASN
jgi:hypothetical protein